jgi:hypothetical protein
MRLVELYNAIYYIDQILTQTEIEADALFDVCEVHWQRVVELTLS